MDTLQYLPPDLQAEVGLALQPLRSENSQLRRRLRIANQQIRQLEQRKDKENDCPLVDVEGNSHWIGDSSGHHFVFSTMGTTFWGKSAMFWKYTKKD